MSYDSAASAERGRFIFTILLAIALISIAVELLPRARVGSGGATMEAIGEGPPPPLR